MSDMSLPSHPYPLVWPDQIQRLLGELAKQPINDDAEQLDDDRDYCEEFI